MASASRRDGDWVGLAAAVATALAAGVSPDQALDQAVPEAAERDALVLQHARDALRVGDAELAARGLAGVGCFSATAVSLTLRLAALRPERSRRLGHALHAAIAGRGERGAAREARLRRTRTRAALVCLIIPVAMGLLSAVEPSWFDTRSLGAAEGWIRQAAAGWLALGALLFALALRRPW